jgi:hypothetical protein
MVFTVIHRVTPFQNWMRVGVFFSRYSAALAFFIADGFFFKRENNKRSCCAFLYEPVNIASFFAFQVFATLAASASYWFSCRKKVQIVSARVPLGRSFHLVLLQPESLELIQRYRNQLGFASSERPRSERRRCFNADFGRFSFLFASAIHVFQIFSLTALTDTRVPTSALAASVFLTRHFQLLAWRRGAYTGKEMF